MERTRCDDGTFKNDGRLLTVFCLHCGKERKVYLSQYNSGRGRYCSKQCAAKQRPRDHNGLYSENSFRTKHNGIYTYRYRLAAEKVLGRPLKKGEVVHHIDGNRNNNLNNNLLICDESYHQFLHYRMNPDGYEKGLKNGRGRTVRRAA